MSALAHNHRVELFVDIIEFYERVGMICDFREFDRLGLERGFSLTSFPPHLVQQLLELCADDPSYHIVSGVTPERLVNKYIPDALSFHLAQGDSTPNLVLNPSVDPKRALVDEQLICSALAISDDGDAGDQ